MGQLHMSITAKRLGFAALAGIAALGMSITTTPAAAEGGEELDQHVQAVFDNVINADIPVSYERVATLMRADNAFGEGAACVVCHNSAKAYNGLDLSSCEGILKGGVTGAFVTPGKGSGGIMRRSLRDNRMPLGISPAYPSNTKNHLKLYDWIKDGVKNDDNFKKNILPLFATAGAFGGDTKCTDCHMSNEEPPSFHEMDLTTWTGIVEKGADSVAKAAEGLPPVLIVKAGNPEGSKLWMRMTENRMPMGIASDADRDPYNLHILMKWVDQGAKCN